MGDWVYRFSKKTGATTLGMPPLVDTSDPSAAQIVVQSRFKQAAAYSKKTRAVESTRAFYEALADERKIPVSALVMGDYLNAPTIQELDLSQYQGNPGDTILINTTDDVGVVTVNVSLVYADGTPIEEGQAVESGVGTGYWIYTATAPVAMGTDIFVGIEAFDRPNNKAVASANPIVGAD